MALATTTSSGAQVTTQNPQTAGKPANIGTQSSSVQSGTATDLLTSQNGVPLTGTVVTTVNLAPVTSTTASAQAVPQPIGRHHINVPLLGISIILLIIGLVLFQKTENS